MALQSINFNGAEIPTAYTRLETRPEKQMVVTVAGVREVAAQESIPETTDEEGNVIPAQTAVVAVVGVEEVKEKKAGIRIVSHTYANAEVANTENGVKIGGSLLFPLANEGWIEDNGTDREAQAYEHVKTLAKYKNSTDI